MTKVKEIQSAFEAAKEVNLTPLELEELEKRRFYAMSEQENLAWARRDGHEEGIEQGIEQSKKTLINILVSKFDHLPASLHSRVEQLNNLEILGQAMVQAATAEQLDSFLDWMKQHITE